jgi:hypothetical protein
MTAAHAEPRIRLGHDPLGQGPVAHAPRGAMADRASCLIAVAIVSTLAVIILASDQLPGFPAAGCHWLGRDQSQAGHIG